MHLKMYENDIFTLNPYKQTAHLPLWVQSVFEVEGLSVTVASDQFKLHVFTDQITLVILVQF